ncbi:MAG: CRP-like cAMP-binding protein [Neolewinella sp.]|jgi:CRP-like cAMP-binding protein
MDKQRLLIIEDNEEVRENLAEILELYGYQTATSRNGLEGVKACIQDPPDMILCDIMMPELDGYGVLNLLSENERTAGIPFIFITAKTETEDIRRGMILGADDYITKPFYKDELLQVIRTRLKKAGVRSNAASPAAEKQVHLSDPDRGAAELAKAFASSGRESLFSQGQSVVREGEFPHFIYQVISGNVHLSRSHEYGRDYIVAELGPGEIFGIPTVLERAPFHYTAKAITEVRCQMLPTKTLLDLINTDRSVTEALMRLLAGRLVEHSERLVHQAYDSVRRRTALVVCDLYEKYDGSPLELSRDELAQMVGSTKESVIRALSDFKREGLLTTEGKTIRVGDVVGLRGLLV